MAITDVPKNDTWQPTLDVKSYEYGKFTDVNGKIGVRTTASGTFQLSGLSTEWRTTTMTVTATAAKLPAIPLTDRNTLIVHNKDAANTVYIGNSDVTADSVNGTTSGWELPPDSYFSIDIANQVELYARCPAGQTAQVKVLEVA